MVCPVNARHFGDLGDPDSEVSQMVGAAPRRGDLLPELGYRPVNKYLPPRAWADGAARCQLGARRAAR